MGTNPQYHTHVKPMSSKGAIHVAERHHDERARLDDVRLANELAKACAMGFPSGSRNWLKGGKPQGGNLDT